MAWINVRDQLPENNQEVYYFSPILGLWRGRYNYSPAKYFIDAEGNKHPATEKITAMISPHVFSCDAGCCDTDEVTHWQPYDAERAAEGWIPLPPIHGITDERMQEYRAWRDPAAEVTT